MSQATIAVHFELYALRQGRWVMDACFADEAEAQAAALRTRHGAEVRGVRVLRELSLPGAPEPVVTVVYDSTQAHETLVFKPQEAARARSEPTPAAHGLQPERHALRSQQNATSGVDATAMLPAWLGYAIGTAGLATVVAVGCFVLL